MGSQKFRHDLVTEQQQQSLTKSVSVLLDRSWHCGKLFLFVCVCVLVTQSCLTLCDPMDCSPPSRLLCPSDFPGKNTGVGCHAFLQGIFPTEGSNLGLLHGRQILYPLSHQNYPISLKKPHIFKTF